MRYTKWLKKGFSLSMLIAVASVLGGGIGCAEETFKCCECRFAMPAECAATDTNITATEFYLCACRSEEYTYEECGVLCKSQVPASLALDPALIGGATRPPITCTSPVAMGAEPAQTLAKNSCNIGSPVGE